MISGNYNTEDEELYIVKFLLNESGIKFDNIYKSLNSDNEDIIVEKNNNQIRIEVKSESPSRIHKYNDLGIDYISAFHFKSAKYENKWKGSPKNPALLEEFESEINILKNGKIIYSKADLWLFYSVDNDIILFYDWFPGEYMTSKVFINYLRQHCNFAINNKPKTQMSYYDNHQSAVFFINRNNYYLSENRIGNLKVYFENIINE